MSIHRLMWSSYGHGFSQLLRSARHARRLSQQALAEISGVSRSQICNLERNENGPHSMADPQLSTIYKLALALEVPPGLLLPGADALVERHHCSRSSGQLEDKVADLAPFPRDYFERRRLARLGIA